MLKKLKIKFILAALLSISIGIIFIIGVINVINFRTVILDADDMLTLLEKNSGRLPIKPDDMPPDLDIELTPESPYEWRYFTVVYREGRPPVADTSNIAAVNNETAIEMANAVIKEDRGRGFFGQYRFLINEKNDHTQIIFLDCQRSLNNATTFLVVSIAVSALSVLIILFILWIMSERILKPMSETYTKQKRFITDAGHDIKTPITIIDADAELLEMDVGENEWLTDIKKQTTRLASLTGDLIYLSRMEETESVPHQDFPISDLIDEVISSFASLAKTKSIRINASIPPAVYYYGDENSVRKLMTVLLDNSIKYSAEGEQVDLSLKKAGKLITFKISNPAPQLDSEAVKRMFDRFYRSDKSRSSVGGFGIGLSVASAIVTAHKGKITAEKQGDLLTIEIIM